MKTSINALCVIHLSALCFSVFYIRPIEHSTACVEWTNCRGFHTAADCRSRLTEELVRDHFNFPQQCEAVFLLVFPYFHRMISGCISPLYISFVASKSIYPPILKRLKWSMVTSMTVGYFIYFLFFAYIADLFLFKPQHSMISCIPSCMCRCVLVLFCHLA